MVKPTNSIMYKLDGTEAPMDLLQFKYIQIRVMHRWDLLVVVRYKAAGY